MNDYENPNSPDFGEDNQPAQPDPQAPAQDGYQQNYQSQQDPQQGGYQQGYQPQQNPGQQYYDPNQQYGSYPEQYPQQVPPPVYVEQKSKIAAGILGILLGSIGIHNFYLGYTGKAIAQLLIAVLTCGAGAVVTAIWGLIEGIMILTGSIAVDSRGIPLKD